MKDERWRKKDESDSDREDYFSKEELKNYLYFKEGLDSDINYSSDSDSD